jgi:glycyl-tRNA synthetase beta subunit
MRGLVDNFFERVLVDDPDPQGKEARIALLSRLGRLFELIADFSRLNVA